MVLWNWRNVLKNVDILSGLCYNHFMLWNCTVGYFDERKAADLL